MNAQLIPRQPEDYLEKLSIIVRRFTDVRALVIGDAIVDRYHFGRVDRISPEAPIPVFIEEHQEVRRGGADNVLAQLEALGLKAQGMFSQERSVKHRYFAGHHHCFRIDVDHDAKGPEKGDFPQEEGTLNVLILSDYGKGYLTHDFCRQVINHAREEGIPVIVDPKGKDWSKYHGATVIMPNERDWAGQGGTVVLKCGSKGLKLIDGTHFQKAIPTRAKTVYDVTGAGDTVTAVFAAAVGAGACYYDACVLANLAAGVVVGKLGTAVCTHEELIGALS